VALVAVANPEDDGLAAAAGRLRARRGAQVLLVRQLPALPVVPHARRPVPAVGLPLERAVGEKIGLGDVEEAFPRMERGEVLRSVVMP
jgi:hypothetical protein